MYSESEYANGLLMYAYSRLPYMTSSTTDIATDDAVTNNKGSNYRTMAENGTWRADNDPMSQWNACKDGIQYANKFMSIVDKVSWAPSADSKQQMFIDRLKGEAYGIRAILYYYLLMAHGGYTEDGELLGVPLLTEPEDASSNFNQPRATFAECVQQCFNDCDSAMALLPMDYKNISNLYEMPVKFIIRYEHLKPDFSSYNLVFGLGSRNRISGRIAEAVKAQIAVLAASPAFREKSGVTSEQAAALCAKVLLHNGGMDGLDHDGHLDWYSYTFKALIDGNVDEVLWRSDRSTDNNQEKENFPPSLYGSGRINPSQNLVDAFPMNNGLPITDPASGYDPKDPYANRDMRLTNCIIYNGATYKKNAILTGVDMAYGPKEDEFDDNINKVEKSTRTGYYLKKLLREDVSANPSSQLTQKHLYPRIRFTEIFLSYAEAANDAWGPNSAPDSIGFTAYDVIKAIRERAGIGKDEFGRPLVGGDLYIEKVKNDGTKMTELIRNERRLELCFENKRFWDLRRWMLPLNEPIKGMRVETNTDPATNEKNPYIYTIINVEDRSFTHGDGSYMWYGPIPKGEILKFSSLKQNKGWQ